MKEIGVGILGFGTVGAGVAEGLLRNRKLMAERLGVDIVLKKVADLDITTDRGIAVPDGVLTTDSPSVIADPDVRIIVETIGGTGVARTFVLNALNAGKCVVTANKKLLAEHGREIFDTAAKNAALLAIADRLEADKAAIDAANARDVENARAAGLSPAMVDRLTLTDARFKSMVDGVRHVASLPDPVGETIWQRTRPSGISIRKVRVPFGVVAVVFESRPNVFVDTAALCLKTGNAIILRGGKEAILSNKALADAVSAALAGVGAPSAAVQFVDILDHAAVAELVRAVGLVDLVERGIGFIR